MRQFLSIILKVTGLALGLGVVALLIALEWPDAASNLSDASAGRNILRVFWLDLLVGFAISWPFLWVAGKLSPESSDDSVHAASE